MQLLLQESPGFVKSAMDSGVPEVEVSRLFDWAEEVGIIDEAAHCVLTREFSRRNEARVREVRRSSQENLMTSFRRALQKGSTG